MFNDWSDPVFDARHVPMMNKDGAPLKGLNPIDSVFLKVSARLSLSFELLLDIKCKFNFWKEILCWFRKTCLCPKVLHFLRPNWGGGVVGIALPIKYKFLPGPDIFMEQRCRSWLLFEFCTKHLLVGEIGTPQYEVEATFGPLTGISITDNLDTSLSSLVKHFTHVLKYCDIQVG